jgi:alpha-D-xyloside xylohydrolase
LVSKITKEETGDNIIWSRSSWAGGQRNPVHWAGDAEVSDAGMSGSLRGGLSLGLSGFSFWSHDIGGFSGAPKEELFKRWAFFGMFTSHSRVHGFPPREPWEFSDEFLNIFRKMVELRYRLMPYIYTQAIIAANNGWPLLKAMFFNYPDDPTTWNLDDQYMFGDDFLIAPIMEEFTNSRNVYLPEGKWIDYQSRKVYEGSKWIQIEAGELPGIILVKNGSVIPHIALAQSTEFMDWSNIRLVVFNNEAENCRTFFCTPRKEIAKLELYYSGKWKLNSFEYLKTNFTIQAFDE